MTLHQKAGRYAIALIAALSAAFLFAAPASARADDTYAAIAFSPGTGAYGYGYGFDSRKGAEKEALAQCSGDDAQVVVWVRNGWCSLAVGDNNAYGYAGGDNAGTVRKNALAECRKRTTNSKVVITLSSDGEVQK